MKTMFRPFRPLTVALCFIVLVPMIGGPGLHWMVDCSDPHCLSSVEHSTGYSDTEKICGTHCSHHRVHHGTRESRTHESSNHRSPNHGPENCSICDFFAISKTVSATFQWTPEIRPLERIETVFSSFVVLIYRHFEFGRAPPRFVA